jgi:hypothetical protein
VFSHAWQIPLISGDWLARSGEFVDRRTRWIFAGGRLPNFKRHAIGSTGAFAEVRFEPATVFTRCRAWRTMEPVASSELAFKRRT